MLCNYTWSNVQINAVHSTNNNINLYTTPIFVDIFFICKTQNYFILFDCESHLIFNEMHRKWQVFNPAPLQHTDDTTFKFYISDDGLDIGLVMFIFWKEQAF